MGAYRDWNQIFVMENSAFEISNLFMRKSINIGTTCNTNIPVHVKKHNLLNIYNPYANSFVPSYAFKASPPLNPLAKEFSVLNPYASVYITLDNRRLENIALIALFSTILTLAAFVLNEINEYDKLEFNNTSPKDILKTLKLKNVKKIIIGHLNINSIRNKIEDLKYLIADNIDILLISETKLNNTFPESQFVIAGFHPPYREDRNENGGGLLLYIREHIPSKKVILNFYPKIEAFAIVINLKKKKWLLVSSYNPHKSMIEIHLNSISKQLDV